MSRSDPLITRNRAAVWRYGVAVASVVAALGLTRLPHTGLDVAPVSVFLCAVMFSAWFGGIGPGLVATVLTGLAFDYFFLLPKYSFTPLPVELPRLIVFILAALFVGTLSAGQRTATESLKSARDELEGTVKELEKTNQALQAESNERKHAEQALRQARSDLERVSRVTTMGELTASLAHEVNQPIAAAVTDANTCLRWLTRHEPDLGEAREAALRVVKDATRAAEVINRVRMLFTKGAPQRELVDINEVIQEMLVLLGSEATRYSISLRSELAADVPRILGDRVQLQQVLMNLMVNAMDAMKEATGKRELVIHSEQGQSKELLISVSDTGLGLPPEHLAELFNPFFTTKLHGTGMGLSISRSIIESHRGRLWAGDNTPRGAVFHFTLPTSVEDRD